ncbi:hypothetical protein, conserved [Eimeria tenella]|uniref:Uncharacterized protein n=1 Tax=Eimeria tenella TaxID=5802 RepID=U6L1S2_EIMTE|nr:hypothetical protein, conserved [Eimeria tenella]CDJ43143.1 hypothetical protein, conserved [Eimeria tenella]|eukprot:XP_013233893.1 hypothetical protein, conserved [Eimeria tenella]
MTREGPLFESSRLRAALSAEAAAANLRFTKIVEEATRKAEELQTLTSLVAQLREKLSETKEEQLSLKAFNASKGNKLKALRRELAAEKKEKEEEESRLLSTKRYRDGL